jgi:methionyl-tRNA formyltransferase
VSRIPIHLFSSDPTALRLLDLLPENINVVAVILPSNRRKSDKVTILAEQATNMGMSLYEHRVRKPLPIDLPVARAGISWMYPQVILDEDIPRYPHGVLNNHMGKLPDYRGFHILQWNIVSGETQAWSTWHEITSVVDGGPIWEESPVTIDQEITAWDLRTSVIREGLRTFPSAWRRFLSGDGTPRIPSVERGRWWRPRTPEDGCLTTGLTHLQVKNIIRASCLPWPRAYVDRNGDRVYVQGVTDHSLPSSIPFQTSDADVVYLVPLESS